MHRETKKRIIFHIFLILICGTAWCDAKMEYEIITRENQKLYDSKLIIKLTEKEDNEYLVMLTIPLEDTTLKGLVNAFLVFGSEKTPFPSDLVAPLRITESMNGLKQISLRISIDLLQRSFIMFESGNVKNPLSSETNVIYLSLGSYIDR